MVDTSLPSRLRSFNVHQALCPLSSPRATWGWFMLFLFNDVVFDLGDPQELALSGDLPFDAQALKRLRIGQVARLVRETMYDEPWLQRTRPEKARLIGALVAWKTGEANAILAVSPKSARSPMDVQLRFADVSLVTMQQLRELQDSDRLSTHTANLAVWSQAPARMSA